MTEKRSTHFRIKLLPQTTIGMLISNPSKTSRKLPFAAPATASTLSRPIRASATTMVFIAFQKLLAGLPCASSAPCLVASSLYAIQTSTRPPRKRRPGTINSQTTTSVMAARTTIAPTVPQMIAFLRNAAGSERAASAITMALSPARTRSMMTIASSAERNSTERMSIAFVQRPGAREIQAGKSGRKKTFTGW